MNNVREGLLHGGRRNFLGSFCTRKRVLIGILGVEMLGIALGYLLMKGYEPGSVLAADYEAVIENQGMVRTELDRIEAARAEDLHMLEALTGLMSAMPEQVKLREITIGDFHNGDWIVAEAVSDDRAAMENYLGTLRQSFEEMRIADTEAGVRITVPMPEGYIWH